MKIEERPNNRTTLSIGLLVSGQTNLWFGSSALIKLISTYYHFSVAASTTNSSYDKLLGYLDPKKVEGLNKIISE